MKSTSVEEEKHLWLKVKDALHLATAVPRPFSRCLLQACSRAGYGTFVLYRLAQPVLLPALATQDSHWEPRLKTLPAVRAALILCAEISTWSLS